MYSVFLNTLLFDRIFCIIYSNNIPYGRNLALCTSNFLILSISTPAHKCKWSFLYFKREKLQVLMNLFIFICKSALSNVNKIWILHLKFCGTINSYSWYDKSENYFLCAFLVYLYKYRSECWRRFPSHFSLRTYDPFFFSHLFSLYDQHALVRISLAKLMELRDTYMNISHRGTNGVQRASLTTLTTNIFLIVITIFHSTIEIIICSFLFQTCCIICQFLIFTSLSWNYYINYFGISFDAVWSHVVRILNARQIF